MIEPLESRQLFAVALDGGVTPLAESQAEVTADAATSTTGEVVTNNLGPTNRQKKHVTKISFESPSVPLTVVRPL